MRALVSVAGHDLPDPSSYKSTTATIVDSGRNVKGVTVGSVIRENVAKIDMTWNFLTAQEWASVTALFDSTRGGNFYRGVTFFNQDTNGWTTRNMYVSDRTAEIFLRNADGSIRGYQSPRLALIEV